MIEQTTGSLAPRKLPHVIKVQRIRSSSLYRKLQIDIGSEHENPLAIDRRNGGIGQSQIGGFRAAPCRGDRQGR
jgi:hypothetical protein